MTAPAEDLAPLVERFLVPGDFRGAERYGTGHINDTYAVRIDQAGTAVRYILQRINRAVFPSIPRLMENVARVTAHLRRKLALENRRDISRRTLTLVPTREGADYLLDARGDFWRMYLFIEKARTYDVLTSPEQAFQAARAFGAFQCRLEDLPGPPLHETIPGFHDGPSRFRAFLEARDRDVKNRAKTAAAEIAFLERNAHLFEILPRLVREGRLPVRSTHNDTKVNNVMMDDVTGEGICVIDLDTLMPGLTLYDFGDLVRTCTCTAPEDERDLSRVTMDMVMFRRLADGYLSAAAPILRDAERSHLAFAGRLITLVIGTRFLTDYLSGDVYFRVHREGHNLDRCRVQFRLAASIAEQEEAMQAYVNRWDASSP